MKNVRRTILVLAAILLGANGVMAAEKVITVKVTNPAGERKAVPVVVEVDDEIRSALVTLNGTEVPCQLDDLDDDGEFEELAFLTNMGNKETQTFKVTLSTTGEPRKYEAQTYGYLGIRDRAERNPKHMEITSVTFPKETNPYNYIYPHGAVMENDMVGFRVYCDHRQSIDYYGHRQLKMDSSETGFYTTQAQRDKGYGEDVLYTGTTYGCGTLQGWDGKTAVMFENVRNRTQTVVCSGPVRTILDITNKAWKPFADKKSTDIRTRYILYRGHRDVEVQVDFSRDVADLPLSTGIVDIVEGSTEFSDHNGLRGDWGRACAGNNPQVYDTITVGLGIFVPKQYFKGESHFTNGKKHLPDQAYVQIVGTKDDDLHYWFACTCDIETFGFANKEAWFDWLKAWRKSLEKPVKIEIK